jgi:inhibitor of cysteine peptidase
MMKWLVLTLVLFSVAGCTDQLGGIDLTESNNGQTITASPNQTLNVKLDSNVTTGYKWNLVDAPNDKILKFVSSRYDAPTSAAIGAGGSETWQFLVVGTGTATLKLAYFRPSSPNQVGKEFTLTVQVQ